MNEIYGQIDDLITSKLHELALGVTVGIVTSLDDEEKMGRVKVKLTNRSTSVYETDFIRVASPMVGEESGMFFMPEVGDEVLVAFCDGDITKPYVIGCLYNKKKKQPAQIEDQKNDVKMIKTKSGHMITFNDKEGEESVEIITSAEMKLTFNDKDTIITVSDKDKKNVITLDAKKGAISIEADKKIEFKAGNATITLDGGIKMEAQKNLEVKGQQVKIEGQSGVNVKSSANLQLEASAMAKLKGAMTQIN